MTNAEQNLANELQRISRQVHENHKLLVFIANRFRAGPQTDFSSEDAAVRQMTQESKDETENVVEAKARIPHQPPTN